MTVDEIIGALLDMGCKLRRDGDQLIIRRPHKSKIQGKLRKEVKRHKEQIMKVIDLVHTRWWGLRMKDPADVLFMIGVSALRKARDLKELALIWAEGGKTWEEGLPEEAYRVLYYEYECALVRVQRVNTVEDVEDGLRGETDSSAPRDDTAGNEGGQEVDSEPERIPEHPCPDTERGEVAVPRERPGGD